MAGTRVVTVRPKVYRGKQGFSVKSYMRNAGPFEHQRASVFTETRESAEKIRARLKAGEEIQAEDWQ